MKSSLIALRDALAALRDALRGSNVTPPTPPPSGDHPYDDLLFNDPNPLPTGDIVINKRPEDITKNDVLAALTLPDLFADIGEPINATWEEMLLDPETYGEYTRVSHPKPFIWTGRGAKLIAGDKKPNKYGVTSTSVKLTLEGDELVWWKDATLNPTYRGYTPNFKNVAYYNARRLNDIANAHAAIDSGDQSPHPNCVGLKLDTVYGVRYDGDTSRNARKPSTWFNSVFYPRRKFIIDGEVDKKAVGGLMFHHGLMVVTDSLVLRKARFMRTNEEGYYSIYVDCEQGIDQLQVIDCVFEQAGPTSDNINVREGHGYAACYIYLYCKNRSPWATAARTAFSDVNVLRHLLVRGNTVYGTTFIYSPMARFSKSYRLVDNTFFGGTAEDNIECGRPYYALHGKTDALVSHIKANNDNLSDASSGYDEQDRKVSESFSEKMCYFSCPLYIVGNRFYGPDRVLSKRVTWSTAHNAVGSQMSQTYFIGNIIRNFATKNVMMDGGQYATEHVRCHATYETYMGVTKLWFANNVIENVVALTCTVQNNLGIFKGKGTAVPSDMRPGWAFANPVRYYVNNKIRFDKEWIWDRWLDATGQKERYVEGRQYDPYDPYTTFNKAVGNNWKPSDWLIDDKYGQFPPMHVVVGKDCPKCKYRNLPTATECQSPTWTCTNNVEVNGETRQCNTKVAHNLDTCPTCGYTYTGSTTLKSVYPTDKYPFLVGERTYDQIFQKGVELVGQDYRLKNDVDEDGIDREFKENVMIHFTDILQESKKESHYITTPIFAYVFENNEVDLGDFCLGGMVGTSSIYSVNFICRNNKFKARRMSSVYTEDNTKKILYTSMRMMKYSMADADEGEYIFNVLPFSYYKSTCEVYDGVSQVGDNQKVYSTYRPGKSYIVGRTTPTSVVVENNQFFIDDFVKNNAVVPTEIKFLRVKYGGKPDIWKDLLNEGKTKNDSEKKVDANPLPTTVVIGDNTMHTPTYDTPEGENEQNILLHSMPSTNWDQFNDLQPTSPST